MKIAIKILGIAAEYQQSNLTYAPLTDFEANFLRLIDKITNGSRIEINQTGKDYIFSAIGINGAPVFWS